ncbi:MAG: hypothetical protein WAQ27_02785 [Candidatus Microsaccharimonas sp.]
MAFFLAHAGHDHSEALGQSSTSNYFIPMVIGIAIVVVVVAAIVIYTIAARQSKLANPADSEQTKDSEDKS